MEVFQTAATSPFLEISITEEKTLCFTVFPLDQEVTFTPDDWERILAQAQAFMPKAIANEEFFQQWHTREGPAE